MLSRIPLLIICLTLMAACGGRTDWEEKARDILSEKIMSEAGWAMTQRPRTIVDFPSPLSEGRLNDYYSEADYWWPDPSNPDGPYIHRDGETNPDIFSGHRHAVIRLSRIVGSLASAYLLTGDEKYAEWAFLHAHAWFVDPDTRMNPDLRYAQAIRGVSKGRRTGIIDTIHFIEVAQGLFRMQDASVVDSKDLNAVKRWFSKYIGWLTTHPNGLDEMNSDNNHAFCWVMQVAAYARFTGDKEVLEFCSQRIKNVLLPQYMGADGSFAHELQRTKPYSYSLFNLDAIATACQILSMPEDNLWEYTAPGGRSVRLGIDFMFPYIKDKSGWTYGRDVMYWDDWPVAHPSLLFGAMAYGDRRYFDVWKKSEHDFAAGEVERNMPVRNPVIWMDDGGRGRGDKVYAGVK